MSARLQQVMELEALSSSPALGCQRDSFGREYLGARFFQQNSLKVWRCNGRQLERLLPLRVPHGHGARSARESQDVVLEAEFSSL